MWTNAPAGGVAMGPLVGSTLVNEQLVVSAAPSAIYPAGAVQPNIGQGAAPANLPGVGFSGGSTSRLPSLTAAASGTPGTPSTATVATVATDFQALPVWQSPLVLTVVFLVLAYAMLRYVHWRP